MRYLKRFNEGYVRNVDELKSFSEQYLAFLLDDNFELNFSTAADYSTTTINLTKLSNSTNARFKWEDIKDIFLPYITILSENYKINDIFEFDTFVDDSLSFFNIFFIDAEHVLNDNIENVEQDEFGEVISDFMKDKTYLSECDILSIEFTIINSPVKESLFINKDNTKELKEFSEQYLAYLYDDGFHVYVNTSRPYSKTTIKFVKNNEGDFSDCETTFTWEDIKDTFISYIGVLSENYELQSVLKFELDFGIRYLEYYVSVDDILNDKIDSITDKDILKYSNGIYRNLIKCDILTIEITIIN